MKVIYLGGAITSRLKVGEVYTVNNSYVNKLTMYYRLHGISDQIFKARFFKKVPWYHILINKLIRKGG